MSTKSRTVTCSESSVSRYWMTLSNAESRVLLCLPERDFFLAGSSPQNIFGIWQSERKFEKHALWYTTSWATQSCKNSIFPLTSRLEHIRNTDSWNSTVCTAFNCPTKDRLPPPPPPPFWSFSSFPQNKHFGLESSDLGCLLFLGDWSFNVFFSLPSMAFWLVYWPRQVQWTKSPASEWMPSCSRSLARFMLWLPFSPRMTLCFWSRKSCLQMMHLQTRFSWPETQSHRPLPDASDNEKQQHYECSSSLITKANKTSGATYHVPTRIERERDRERGKGRVRERERAREAILHALNCNS